MKKYKVAVLLASHDGANYLHEQIASIQSQVGVSVDIYFSDDISSDCSRKILLDHGCEDLNIEKKAFEGAAKNFFSMISKFSAKNYSHVFLADQDDIWLPKKCISSINALEKNFADFYCGSYISFANEKMKYVNKSLIHFPDTCIFQSAGPGFTFCFTQSCFNRVKTEIIKNRNLWKRIRWHDWYIYNLIKALKLRCYVDEKANALYRLHTRNDTGQLNSVTELFSRFKYVFFGRYREQILLLQYTGPTSEIRNLVADFRFRSRLKVSIQIYKIFHLRVRSLLLILWALFSTR